MMMFMVWNSARNESKDVNVPGPAISGNAIGTMDAPLGDSCLNNSRSEIISKAKMRRTIEPAMAKDSMFTPSKLRMALPIKRNTISIANATQVALKACIWLLFWFLRLMIMGNEPSISITANNTIEADIISSGIISICKWFMSSF